MIENLIDNIHHCFDKNNKPDKEHIFVQNREDLKEPLKIYSETKWNDLDSDAIRCHYRTIPSFTPEALHYFLPAFLIYVLKNIDPNDEVSLFIIYTLSPGKEYEKGIIWWRDRFQCFSQDQMSVIYNFLDLICSQKQFKDFASIIQKGKIRLQNYTDK